MQIKSRILFLRVGFRLIWCIPGYKLDRISRGMLFLSPPRMNEAFGFEIFSLVICNVRKSINWFLYFDRGDEYIEKTKIGNIVTSSCLLLI